jgi:hypothetical protein
MAQRERRSDADAHMRELDAALSDLVRALDSALKHAPEGGSGTESATAAAAAVRSVAASIARRLPADGDQRATPTSARSAIEALARHAKAELRRSTYASSSASEWERNAALSVRAGDDNLARDALSHRAECLLAAKRHADQAALLDEEIRLLKSALDELDDLK